MNPPSESMSGTGELEALNRELAELLHEPPMDLSVGADAALLDDLVICGILGGKDVGKSTLINALARRPISVDLAEVGRGTSKPVAYVHENAKPAVASRLEIAGSADWVTHTADTLRNVVLVDLPDFDSEFLDHADIVRRMLPRLDRVVWVMSPRKIGDRTWVQLTGDVFKEVGNVSLVLNKVDELLSDEGPRSLHTKGTESDAAAQFWRYQHAWVADTLRTVGHDHDDHQRFLVSAGFPDPQHFVDRIGLLWDDPQWTRYAQDKATIAHLSRLASDELSRLRGELLHPISSEQATAIKEGNRRREREVLTRRLAEHFRLEDTQERLRTITDPQYLEQALEDSLGQSYRYAVAASLEARLRSDADLAGEWLQDRVSQWPLLSLVYWPFGWLARWVGRMAESSSRQSASRGDPFEVGGLSLERRLELLRSRIIADEARLVERWGLEVELPQAETIARRMRNAEPNLIGTCEQRMLQMARGRESKPSLALKTGLWLILLWFTLLQPIVEEAFRVAGDFRAMTWIQALGRCVTVLSAAHLLTGLAVVAGIFLAILAGMFQRRVRAIHKVRVGREAETSNPAASIIVEELDGWVGSNVLQPLVTPFQTRLDGLIALEQRLNNLARI